jgi:TonB family protein
MAGFARSGLLGLALFSSLAEAGSSVTGRFTWAEDGAVRVVVAMPIREVPAAREIVAAQVTNEGALATSLGRGDRWLAVSDSGKEVELRAEPVEVEKGRKALELAPCSLRSLRLVFPRSTKERIVGYRLRRKGVPDLEIRAAWVAAVQRTAAALPLPPAGAIEAGPVEVGILVGVDGRVEHVAPRSGNAALREAATWALADSLYEPAREDDRPVPSVEQVTLDFSERLVARLSFAGLPEEVVPRVRAAIAREFSRVVERPAGDGLVIVGKPTDVATARGVRLYLVRWGPEPAGHRTWVAIATTGYGTLPGIACDMWLDQEGAAADFAAWLVGALGTAPLSRSALIARSPTSVPSGVPEPAESSEWGSYNLSRFARASLDAGPDGPFSVTWNAPEPASGPEPHPVGEAVEPPKVKVKVEPLWRGGEWGGQVIVMAIIDEHGDVREAQLIKRATPSMNGSALAAVCQWKYEPAKIGQVPVAVYFTVVINFAP